MGKRGHTYSKAQIKQLKADYLDALRSSAGLVTQACKKVGIGSRNTIILWRKRDPAFDEACEEAATEASEMALDLAESALMRNIQAGDTKAIKFYLNCKGKSRGYGQRQEIDLNADLALAEPPVIVFGKSESRSESEPESESRSESES